MILVITVVVITTVESNNLVTVLLGESSADWLTRHSTHGIRQHEFSWEKQLEDDGRVRLGSKPGNNLFTGPTNPGLVTHIWADVGPREQCWTWILNTQPMPPSWDGYHRLLGRGEESNQNQPKAGSSSL